VQAESMECATLRALLTAKSEDDSWIKDVTEVIPEGFKRHQDGSPYLALWQQEWGSIQWYRPADDGPLAPALVRTDGGPMLIGFPESQDWAKMTRYALVGLLIQSIRRCKLLSYAKVGYPQEWRTCKIYHNGNELDHVTWADAVLGQAQVLSRKGGKFVENDGSMATMNLVGSITIEPGQKDLGFF
jgi:hypothetical protein